MAKRSKTKRRPSPKPRKGAKKRRARKSDGSKRRAVRPPVFPAGVQSEFAATVAGCLDQEVATALVFSCTGVGAVPPATPLGRLFPSDVQRRGFCGCVFNKARMSGSSVTPADVPCSAANTVADVIDAISC